MKKQKNKGKNNIVTADFEKSRGDRNQKLYAIPTQAPLKSLTIAQNNYRKSILKNQITFGIGPAGTGKTYVAVAVAINALLNKTVEKVIITRPAVESGETLGFLPGKLADKFAPYLAPMRNVFHERLGRLIMKVC